MLRAFWTPIFLSCWRKRRICCRGAFTTAKIKQLGPATPHATSGYSSTQSRSRGTSMHTPHEINVVFDPGFPNLPEEVQHAKDDDLHDRLHELGPVPHRDEPRGRGSPNYGKYVNLPPKRRKKGK